MGLTRRGVRDTVVIHENKMLCSWLDWRWERRCLGWPAVEENGRIRLRA